MATEAQIEANRRNAERSTGPRTAAGKAVVAQNAVKHGLLGEQVVVEGEDRARYARHRDEMLRALGPLEEVEITLAERLIGLSWRLQRVQRLQVQAFEALCAGPEAGPGEEGSDEELALGRIVVKDFSEGRVLDRLLMYERRLEHSLCRILGELRKERLFHNLEARTMDKGQPQVLLERLMGKLRDSPSATLRVGPGCARYEETPAQASPAEAAEELWERLSSGECEVSQGRPALETCNVTLAAPEAAPDGGAGLPHPTERGEEPNPISGRITAQGVCEKPVLGGMGLGSPTHNSALGVPFQPMDHRQDADATRPTGLEVGVPKRVISRLGAPATGGLPTFHIPSPGSGLSELTPDLRPPIPAFSCETNPIRSDAKEGQVLDAKGVMSDSLRNGLEKTNPIFAQDEACQCLVEPVGVGAALAADPAR